MNRKWCLLVFCLLPGCSNDKLDRKSAAREIQSHLKDGQSSIVVQVGRVGSHCVHVNQRDGKEVEQDLNPQTSLSTIVAAKAGYVTVIPDGDAFWRVSLTDKGAQVQDPSWQVSGAYHNQLKGCDYKLSAFVVAHPEVSNITGISGDQKEPAVDFEWRWIATELGAALRDNGSVYSQLTPQQRTTLSSVIQAEVPTSTTRLPVPVPLDRQIEKETVRFRKYDDGWRSQ